MTANAPEPAGENPVPTPAAIAATEEPVQLEVGLVEDERVPDGMVCMGTFRNGRLVARAVLTPEAWAQIEEHGFFDEPLQVVLVARLAPPGLQCQLFAMVPLPRTRSEEAGGALGRQRAELLATSPRSNPSQRIEDDPAVAPIPLGNIVRFAARPGASREPAARDRRRAEEDHRGRHVGGGGSSAVGSCWDCRRE